MRLAAALTNLGQLESDAGNFDRATQVLQEALAIDRKQGDMLGVALDQQSLAGVHLRAGRAREARDQLSAMAGYVVSCGDPELLATTLEMSAANAAQLGEALRAARHDRRRGSRPAEDRHPDKATRNARGVPGSRPRDHRTRSVGRRAGRGRALTQQQAVALLLAQD
jgi:tetratricopeptide (TPR) repeat protein